MGALLATFTRYHLHSQHLRSVTAAHGQLLLQPGHVQTPTNPPSPSRPCILQPKGPGPEAARDSQRGTGVPPKFVGLGSGGPTWCSRFRCAAGRVHLESNRDRRARGERQQTAPLPSWLQRRGRRPHRWPAPTTPEAGGWGAALVLLNDTL